MLLVFEGGEDLLDVLYMESFFFTNCLSKIIEIYLFY